MAELKVAMTYARALYQVAKERDKVETVAEDLVGIRSIFEKEEDFVRFLSVPSIQAKEKISALNDIFLDRVSGEVLNFLCILVEKGRIGHFVKIADAFKDIRDREEGFAKGIIYSVVPLEPEIIAKFEKETSKLLKERVKLENGIDESLIGGVKITVKGKIIDASVKSRVSALAAALIK